MNWNFRDGLPIYTQLIGQIRQAIVAGDFAPGERLPSVRELALEAGVNPNTMQRALAELERDGLVFAQRTAGRFVTEDQALIRQARQELARAQIAGFLAAMDRLGYPREELLALVRQEMEKENDNGSGM